jgi:5-methylcytosine-specific restriction enzyme A
MARTQGHGNPKWTRDEAILALALYFESGKKILPKTDPRVESLSEILRQMPFHDVDARKDSFRNPDGVALKLQNFHFLATGEGLGNTSTIDKQVWRDFHDIPGTMLKIAEQIKMSAATVSNTGLTNEIDEDVEFFEGRTLTEIHKRIERNSTLRRRFVNTRKEQGKLRCDLCGTEPRTTDPKMADAIFEVHHLIPVSQAGERKVIFSDLALLCANCHRSVHRVISLNGEWLSIADCRILLEFA